jgi:hypothetical protein
MTQPNEPNEDDVTAELLDAELPRSDDDLPPIDFSTFVVSLRASALLHMGQGDEPDLNLALARQEIDLLAVLEEKTRGNLTGDEELLLSQVLFDLRTRYITTCSRKS